MNKIYNSSEELIGNTPLLRLSRLEKKLGLQARLYAKLEYLNPAGSIKDRAAKSMLDAAEASGELKDGSVIIEATSGNTGIGLASIAAVRGYRIIIVMPESMSAERRALMKAYGAELILTDAKLGMSGAVEKAKELAGSIKGSYMSAQFDNPANPAAHFDTTGPEIYAATDGELDFFVAGVGTGGTLSGTGSYLKSRIASLRVVAVEPALSPVLSGGSAAPHGLQGIGAGFVPSVLDRELIDEVITVSDEQAYESCRLIGKTEGFLAGISSGAAFSAAITLARRSENANKRIVIIFPDSGERYLSSNLYV